MAVKNEGDIYPTEDLISRKDRKHYKLPVRSQHWQLRSLIGVENGPFVYLPGGQSSNQVQRLNTTTRECETIKLLTFAPRCLVAEKGWLCCGGENGEFVAMPLDDGNETIDAMILQAVAKSMKLAKYRVNCITLWFPPTSMLACDEAYSEPVAILANNDKTVALVSLREFQEKDKADPLDVITYPDYVNRGIISPDGSLLIAILDDPYLYVHKRVKGGDKTKRSRDNVQPRWEQTQRILLKSQKKVDASDGRGSFAACFSNSGAYLAVGTQYGIISIFDTQLLRSTDVNVNPLITTLHSCRPRSGPGAVRDMAFCPGPYDLLAWTEDRSIVGIVDMRSGFIVRQKIDINDPSFDHIDVLDRRTIDPRLLETRRERPRLNVTTGEATNLPTRDVSDREAPVRRTLEITVPTVPDNLNSPLTANETVVLEAMQNERRRRERTMRSLGENRQAGIPNTNWAERPRRGPLVDSNTTARGTERRAASIGRAIEDLLPTYREQRDRVQDRVRASRQLLRDSAANAHAPGSRRLDLSQREAAWSETAARLDQLERQGSSYLTILEILQGARDRTPGERDDDTALLVPLVNQVVNRMEESAMRNAIPLDHGVFEVPPSPDNTSGLAWSDDGRILYVGAQNGIYELHVNTHGRKLCPSVEMR